MLYVFESMDFRPFRFNAEMDQVIAALADGSLSADPVITHEFPFSEALEAFSTARDASRSGKVLLSFTSDLPAGTP